jgi:hypothetical protein
LLDPHPGTELEVGLMVKVVPVLMTGLAIFLIGFVVSTSILNNEAAIKAEHEVFECPYCHHTFERWQLLKVATSYHATFYCPDDNANGTQVIIPGAGY